MRRSRSPLTTTFLSQVLTWDSHRHLQVYIEAAISSGKPPLFHILEDSSHKKWNKWDIRIFNAYHMLKNFEVNGEPVWRDTSPRVQGVVKFRHSQSKDALDRWEHGERKRMEKKNATPKFGVIPYAVLQTKDGGPMPTKREWLEAMESGSWGEMPAGKMRLPSGKVVDTVVDPELMREKQREFLAKRRRR